MFTFARFRRALVLIAPLVGGTVGPGCSCDPPAIALSVATTPCISQHAIFAEAEPSPNKTIKPGTLHAGFGMDESGQPLLAIPLDVAAGRGAPSLALAYGSGNIAESIAGGFSLTGVEALTRCNRTIALDGTNRAVRWDELGQSAATRLPPTTLLPPQEATMLMIQRVGYHQSGIDIR